jgi:hypothetical protein
MNLLCMTIPDEPDKLAAWLEGHLVGLGLAELTAELLAIHGEEAGPPLAEVLQGRQAEVLAGGLTKLRPAALRLLLRHPRRLLELQDLILAQGGPYWDRVAAGDAELNALVTRGAQRLQLGREARQPVLRPIRPPIPRTPARRPLPWVVGLAIAATLLLAIFFGRSLIPKPNGPPLVAAGPSWGWAKPGALPTEGSAADYLRRLAAEAKEWSNQRPEEPAALAKRILEFRQGCSTLIFAEHKPLAAEDRRWLVQKCQEWAAKFDQALAALEGGKEVAEVRKEMDATMAQLVQALLTRSEKVEAG